MIVAGGSAMLAAPGQATLRPGEMTQARVWVQNRAPHEAVPVSLQDASSTMAPLRVRVVTQTAPNADEPLRVTASRQQWSYRTIVMPAGSPVLSQDLTAAGRDGWEVTGVTFGAPDGGIALLLKRPN